MTPAQQKTYEQAKAVFNELGLTETQAIELFFKQVAKKQKLPFTYKPKIKPQTLVVFITNNEDIWTGVCDPLGLVTEGDSYAEVEQRAKEIAPELAELNGITNYKLAFGQSISFS